MSAIELNTAIGAMHTAAFDETEEEKGRSTVGQFNYVHLLDNIYKKAMEQSLKSNQVKSGSSRELRGNINKTSQQSGELQKKMGNAALVSGIVGVLASLAQFGFNNPTDRTMVTNFGNKFTEAGLQMYNGYQGSSRTQVDAKLAMYQTKFQEESSKDTSSTTNQNLQALLDVANRLEEKAASVGG